MTTLDHAGLAGPDGPALHARYETLGFTLTPLAHQSGRLRADGPVVAWGTANRCAMLEGPEGRSYIELLGVTDPAAPLNGLDRFLARHPGLHILALGIEDEDAALARLRRGGLDIPGVLHLHRPVDSADPAGPQARFARLPLPDAPEGRIQLIRHLTPDAIWQPRFTAHRNGARALDAAILAVPNPAETAARLSRLSGHPVVPDPAGGFALPLHPGLVRILPADALPAVLPGVLPPVLPFMAGMVVRTGDAAAAVRALVPGLVPVPGGGWMASPDLAGGAALVFT